EMRDPVHVAAKLQRISQSLLGMQQDLLARNRLLAAPTRCGEVPAFLEDRTALILPSPLVFGKSLLEISAEQQCDRFVEVSGGVIGVDGKTLIVARKCGRVLT